ncbi:28S ribosomal protein S24, mitochondrial, partial [Clarias magur]
MKSNNLTSRSQITCQYGNGNQTKMAASLSRQGRILFIACSHLNSAPCLSAGSRSINTSAVCYKNRAARIRVGKGDRPVTYEQALHPHHIAHRKGWLSQHT